MARNPRQEMDLPKLIEDFGSDDKCRDYLEDLRWPEGVRCPRCDSDKIARIRTRKQYDCSSCRYRFSVTVGTIFHDSHLALWKWFAAVYLMVESKKGISSNQLKRTLRVADKTAWFLTHRIRAAMKDDNPEPLEGIVEADETYIGGKTKGAATRQEAALRRRDNKSVVVGAIERGGELRVRAIPNAKKGHVRRFLDDNVSDEATLYSDSHRSYRNTGRRHEFVDHSSEEWVRGDVHTNTIESAWSLFDRAMIGSYHKLSKKHLPAYLDEFAFRFNGRENPYLFRDTLLRLVGEEPLTYDALTQGRTSP